MKIQKAQTQLTEPTIPLKEAKHGDVIRFAHDSFQDALKADAFYLRIEAPEAKDRVRLANLADGKQLERDGDHRIVVHKAVLHLE